MKILLENLKQEFHRDTYWTKICITSSDDKKKTLILTCASYEYLSDTFSDKNSHEIKPQDWINSVIEKWKLSEDCVFSDKVHYDVYARTQEGKNNGLEFLKSEFNKKQICLN